MVDKTIGAAGQTFREKSLQLKSCNLEYLHRMSSGDESFVKEMIKLFLKQVPQELEKLSLVANDSQAVRQIAHKLKSSVSMVGAEDLLVQVKELEQKATNGVDALTVVTYQKELYQKYSSIQEELELLLS
jgi:HPt (histidine-containing phosphotransfer) domain-containing protein